MWFRRQPVPNQSRRRGLQDFWKSYDLAIEKFDLKKVLELTTALAIEANQYVDSEKPWQLAKSNMDILAFVIYCLLEWIRQISLAFLPFIPISAQKVLSYLGQENISIYGDLRLWGQLKSGSQLEKTEPLFPKAEVKAV